MLRRLMPHFSGKVLQWTFFKKIPKPPLTSSPKVLIPDSELYSVACSIQSDPKSGELGEQSQADPTDAKFNFVTGRTKSKLKN